MASSSSAPTLLDEADLQNLQSRAFAYFEHEHSHVNGLIADKNAPDWPASIAATGLALASYPVAIERGLLDKRSAIDRTLKTLRFFLHSPQGPEPDATGHHGFYYHFLDLQTGRRAWECELSSVDTAFLIAGMLTTAAYFCGDNADEREIRSLADTLYRRVDWPWLLQESGRLGHGWKPETGFIVFSWQGYDESLLLHVLALGSPTHPVPASTYQAWTDSFVWKHCYGIDYLYSAALFTHQLSHVWLDLRGIADEPMRDKNLDYFENSSRATRIQQRYAIDNPHGFTGYGDNAFGFTASDGPGPCTHTINGVDRRFYDYENRGAPDGVDDGTLAPWAVVASLPFEPQIVTDAVRHYTAHLKLHDSHRYGFRATFNPTFEGERDSRCGWVSPWHYGLNIGPIVLMIENCRSGLIWGLMRQCPYIRAGLRAADFTGGWLDDSAAAEVAAGSWDGAAVDTSDTAENHPLKETL